MFNRNAGTRLDANTASLDTLDAIKQKPSRVCPLVCEHGFKADGERCSKIVCAEGSFLNDDNECEKHRAKTPTASRERQDRHADRREVNREDRRERFNRAERYDRVMPGYDSGYAAPARRQSQPLTGSERALGCNSNQAIMSGVCPQ